MTPAPVVPAVTALRLTGAKHRGDLPLLVLGPSLGTSAATLWTACATGLTDVFDVVAWDLPGHGHNRSVPQEPWSVADLAVGVLRVVDDVLEQRGETGGSFAYAGDSLGGAVGLHLLLDAPARVSSAVLMCTGAQIGEPAAWRERATTVRASGTSSMVAGSSERWFAPGFLDRSPAAGSALLHALTETVDEGYAQCCEALAEHDVRDRLPAIAAPVMAIAGAVDEPTPPASLQLIADGVLDGRLVVLPDVAHLAPVEAPVDVARLIREHVLGEAPPIVAGERYEAGLAVRREVLGDEHVDRATAGATALTEDFQRFITEYAWGGVWTRPGLDRRTRSLITITALVARGHHEELAMHLRAAIRNGVSIEEIRECLLQSAIYCGVPDANAAFRVAQGVLGED